MKRLLAMAAAAMMLSACGYHVVGSMSALSPEIRSIAVPAWANGSVQPNISGRMAEAVSRELIARTHYAVVADPGKADAVLYGSLANMFAGASVVDPVSGRATAAQIVMIMQVRLVDKSGKVLLNRPNLEFREQYEISIAPGQYFDESEAARQRVARDMARTVVSAILEAF